VSSVGPNIPNYETVQIHREWETPLTGAHPWRAQFDLRRFRVSPTTARCYGPY
jgi:hypothetical protein